MLLHESIVIHTTPDRIFRFFEEMEDNYTRWHPDHLRFQWVAGRGVREGTIFSFEERIAGEHQKKRVVFTRVEPNRHLEFAPTSRLVRLFLPRLLFHVESEGDACRFTAEIQIRLGPLAKKLHERQLALVRQHMREEGENLKRLLETETAAGAREPGRLGNA